MKALKQKLESMLILFLTKKDNTLKFSQNSENAVGFLVLTIEESGEIQTVFKITSKDSIDDLLKSADLFSKTNKNSSNEAKMPASTNDSSEEERGDVSQPKSTKTEAEAEEVKAFIASCFNEDVITQLKGSSLFDLVHKKSTGQVSTKQEDSDNQQMHHNEFQQFFERTYVGLNKMSSDGHGSGEEIETESFSQETKSDNYLEEFMQLLVA